MNSEWEAVIGLEIHMQLKAQSKIFSAAATAYGAAPNTQACAVDIALPGALPALNIAAVRMAVAFGLAIDAEIVLRSVFERKNYFYPDLPKGYQISQYQMPIVANGHLDITADDGARKTIGIERAHLEEDAGKLVHDYVPGMSAVDLNRAGVPLMEIVSRPQLSHPAEAVAYMKKIHAIGRYLDICDGNMQEGSLRCDANVSVRRKGESKLGVRAEVKNLNSFRFVEKAIAYEIKRQIALCEEGGEVTQETRQYDDDKNQTRAMRGKEDAHDYRYFPDPDLLPVEIDPSLIEQVRGALPESQERRQRVFIDEYGLSEEVAGQLLVSAAVADYFESCCAAGSVAPKQIANWIIMRVLAHLNRQGIAIENAPLSPRQLATLLARVDDGTIAANAAKQVFDRAWESGGEATDIDALIKERALESLSGSDELEKAIDEVIAASPKQIEQYRAGKTKMLGYFVGQVMKATAGRADPAQANRLLKARLDA